MCDHKPVVNYKRQIDMINKLNDTNTFNMVVRITDPHSVPAVDPSRRRTDGQSLQEKREQMFIRKVSSKITVINYFKNSNTQRALSLTESPAAVIVSKKQTHRWQKCYFFDLPTEV